MLLTGGQALALEVECLTPKSCPASSPSAYLGGFTPAAPPDAAGPNGAPVALRVDLKCPPGRTACSASAMVPARATAIDLTDVLLQNPANDTGTVTLKSAGKTILVEGLDSFRDLPFTFTAPLVLAPRAQVTLSVKCTNPEKNCTPGVLLAGVLHEPPPSK